MYDGEKYFFPGAVIIIWYGYWYRTWHNPTYYKWLVTWLFYYGSAELYSNHMSIVSSHSNLLQIVFLNPMQILHLFWCCTNFNFMFYRSGQFVSYRKRFSLSYSRLLCFLILIWDLVIFEVFFIKFNYNNWNVCIWKSAGGLGVGNLVGLDFTCMQDLSAFTELKQLIMWWVVVLYNT